MKEEDYSSITEDSYSSNSENSDQDNILLPPALFGTSDDEETIFDSDDRIKTIPARKLKPVSKSNTKKLSSHKRSKKYISEGLSENGISDIKPIKKLPSQKRTKKYISESESENSVSDTEPVKKPDKNVRDSLINFFIDPRKLRRTPIPESFTESSEENPRNSRSFRNSGSPKNNNEQKTRSVKNNVSKKIIKTPKTSLSSLRNRLSLNNVPPERRFSVNNHVVESNIDSIILKKPRESPKEYIRESPKEYITESPKEYIRESPKEYKRESPKEYNSENDEQTKISTNNSSETSSGEDKFEKCKKNKTRADEIRERMQEEETKEKRELIYEFWLMEKQGIPVSKKYLVVDNIDEMRFEYHRLKSEGDIRDKIKLGWSLFSCVSSIGEMINQKLDPLGISVEGWSEELDSQRQEYEKVFRKIYKNMASRFYVRPGLQLMMMFGSQFLLFLAPRLLKKFQKKDEDDNRGIELDKKGFIIPSSTEKKIGELQENVLDVKNQFTDQLAKMQQQQMLLLQAQQKFFDSITALLNKKPQEINLEPQNVNQQTGIKNTEQKLPLSNNEESEYEEVEVEVTDDDPDTNLSALNTKVISKADEDASNSIGEVIMQMQPMVNMFRILKTTDKDVPLNTYMYDNPPEIPETMLVQHEKLVKKGFIDDKDFKKKDDNVIETKISPEKTLDTRKSSKKIETWNLD